MNNVKRKDKSNGADLDSERETNPGRNEIHKIIAKKTIGQLP